MFSYWLGRLCSKDIRQFGDGNPGAANAFKACGWKIGLSAMLLDFSKGFIPVFIVYYNLKIQDYRIVPIVTALILGHAFSVFLKFNGGKGIAITFGIWGGLTLWRIPLLLGLNLVLFKFIIGIKNDAYNIIWGLLGVLIFLLSRFNALFLAIWVLNFSLIVLKHRKELKRSFK
jgi:glycerol-3-phosphate acyltransferase PlsY